MIASVDVRQIYERYGKKKKSNWIICDSLFERRDIEEKAKEGKEMNKR